MEISFNSVIPILRIFDVAKADEFYLGFLGFSIDWDHRFDLEAPLYRQVSRDGLVLHLSENHGDGTRGAGFAVMRPCGVFGGRARGFCPARLSGGRGCRD